MEKAKDRLEVLEKIKFNEQNGLWNDPVENDPPSKVLMPDQNHLIEATPLPCRIYFALPSG